MKKLNEDEKEDEEEKIEDREFRDLMKTFGIMAGILGVAKLAQWQPNK